MFDRLRRYDVQATYSAVLSMAGALPAFFAVALVIRNYEHDLGQIVYGSHGWFVPALLAGLGLSIPAAGAGFLLGWSSAGQRRNDKPARSWFGFFLGGALLTLDFIVLAAFYLLKLEQPV